MFNVWVMFCSVFQYGDIGQNECIGVQLSGYIYCLLLVGVVVGMSEGIDGDMQFMMVLMYKVDGFLQFFFGEIKVGKVVGVGVIFQFDIDGIGVVFDGCFKCWKVIGWVEQFYNFF